MQNSGEQPRSPDTANRAAKGAANQTAQGAANRAAQGAENRAAKGAASRHRLQDEPLGRPRTSRLPKPRAERASQFMPFAALTGFEDYLRATDEEREQMYADDEFAHPEDFSEWD